MLGKRQVSRVAGVVAGVEFPVVNGASSGKERAWLVWYRPYDCPGIGRAGANRTPSHYRILIIDAVSRVLFKAFLGRWRLQ